MTDRERIEILEAKIAFLMAVTTVQGQRLERLSPITVRTRPRAASLPIWWNVNEGDIRCVDGRLMRHDPQTADPDLETDVGKCPERAAQAREIAALRELPSKVVLAKAIFETGGSTQSRCRWGQRPCGCQDSALSSASEALRGLAALKGNGEGEIASSSRLSKQARQARTERINPRSASHLDLAAQGSRDQNAALQSKNRLFARHKV